jgi:hypothetical protein
MMDSVLAKAVPARRKSYALLLRVHTNNYQVHFSNTQKQFDENSLVALPHSPYNHD